MFVVAGVPGLIGIDECEIETSAFTRGDQARERLFGWRDAEIDLIGHSRLSPVTAGYGSVLFIHVAGDQLAAGRERERDRRGTVAGENADFDSLFRLGHGDQNAQKLAVFGRNLKVYFRMRLGLVPQTGKDVRLPDAILQDIVNCGGIDEAFVSGHK